MIERHRSRDVLAIEARDEEVEGSVISTTEEGRRLPGDCADEAIGRGEHPSLCLLFGPKSSERLAALAAHRDGFRLAEIDLALRGEGELTGIRQSGLAAFRFARLPEDASILDRARAVARDLLEADFELGEPEHVLLNDALLAAHAHAASVPIPA